MPRKSYKKSARKRCDERSKNANVADTLEGFYYALVGSGGVFVPGVGLVSGLLKEGVTPKVLLPADGYAPPPTAKPLPKLGK